MPNIPSLPMNAPRRSNREFSESKMHTSPDGSTTSRARMCAEVTPSDRQCGPPELFATFPPMVQLCWLEGSGAKCKPNCEVWRDKSAFSTPGSTHAVRLCISMLRIRFIFVREITNEPSVGMAPPAKPVPAPRAMNATPLVRAQRTAFCTSSVVVG